MQDAKKKIGGTLRKMRFFLQRTITRREVVLSPIEFVTVRETEYVPGTVKVLTGFRSVDVCPSPKSHCHPVGLLKDRSVN